MSITALTHLVSVKGVASAFVFNDHKTILAREVPDQYSTEGLTQLAAHVLQFQKILPQLGELRFGYENFGLWYRRFGPSFNCHLVVFTERDADFALLRQPINLAVLNLAKVIRQLEEEQMRTVSQSDLYKTALEAEKELFTLSGEDSNQVFAKLSLLSEFFIGPIGPEILQQSCHRLNLDLPLKNPDDLNELIQAAATSMGNSQQKQAWLTQAEDIIQRV
ncbi:MAG: hypothetical protein ACOY3I_01185 [Verrucomicrobiota bacterium]